MRRSKQLDLFIFVDALGWKFAEENQFLSDLLPYRTPCETVFGSSSACDPTILTGVLPADHGHFSCFVKAGSKRSPFANLRLLKFLPRTLSSHRFLRSPLSKCVARYLGISGNFQLFSVPFSCLPYLDYTGRRDIYSPGGIIGGQPIVFEFWEQMRRNWMRSDWRFSDEENIAATTAQIAAGNIEFAYLFTANLDACLHRHGVNHPEARRCLGWFADQIRALHAAAEKRYHDVRIHVFSDHGMSDVHHASDLMLRWERSCPFRYGKGYVAVWDSTMARFWFDDPGAKIWAESFLADQPDGRILTTSDLVDWGCDFPGQRYGELFYLLPPGSIFAPSFMNRGFVTAMHGYGPDHPGCAACWLTNHPHYPLPSHLTDFAGIVVDAARYRSKRGALSPDPAPIPSSLLV